MITRIGCKKAQKPPDDIIVSNIVMGYFNGSLEGKMRWCLRASVYVSRELQDFAVVGLGSTSSFWRCAGIENSSPRVRVHTSPATSIMLVRRMFCCRAPAERGALIR